jgi:hypothetical protein
VTKFKDLRLKKEIFTVSYTRRVLKKKVQISRQFEQKKRSQQETEFKTKFLQYDQENPEMIGTVNSKAQEFAS